MRVIVPHSKSREDVIQTIDRSLNDLFQQSGTLPVRLVEQQRSWQGSTLTFSLAAKMGIVSTPIKGTVEVTDRDVTIDVDLGMFERMISAEKARGLVASRVQRLLK
jgi:Putative polyhydroxyalkanoic acid system protein (PHA_gran_rgn)